MRLNNTTVIVCSLNAVVAKPNRPSWQTSLAHNATEIHPTQRTINDAQRGQVESAGRSVCAWVPQESRPSMRSENDIKIYITDYRVSFSFVSMHLRWGFTAYLLRLFVITDPLNVEPRALCRWLGQGGGLDEHFFSLCSRWLQRFWYVYDCDTTGDVKIWIAVFRALVQFINILYYMHMRPNERYSRDVLSDDDRYTVQDCGCWKDL